MPETQRLTETGESPRSGNRRRAVIGGLFVVVAIGFAGLAVYRERHPFADSLRQIGVATLLASLAAGLVASAANMPVWRAVLRGLRVEVPWRSGARVFYVSQLGKYLPGAIWPVVIQMEALRQRGASRRTAIAANLITIALGCAVGLVVACLLLPISDTRVLGNYWWVLLALPPLLASLHPRVVPIIVNRVLAVLHRPPIDAHLDLRSTARAGAWSLLSWVALGAHVAILAGAVGGGGVSTFLLCTGGAALAVAAGILVVPVPAGVGIRDAILGLVLAANLSTGEAIAVVVISRVMLIVADIVLAGAAAALRPGRTAVTKARDER